MSAAIAKIDVSTATAGTDEVASTLSANVPRLALAATGLPTLDTPEGLSIWHDRPDEETIAGSDSPQVTFASDRESSAQSSKISPLALTTSSAQDQYQVRRRWRGVVQEISEDSFDAEIFDQDHADSPREAAEFSMEDVDLGDLSLVQPGAVFYWMVGYVTTRGTRRTFSEIRFRRLPVWTRAELAKLEEPSDVDDLFD